MDNTNIKKKIFHVVENCFIKSQRINNIFFVYGYSMCRKYSGKKVQFPTVYRGNNMERKAPNLVPVM
jgi:hypothetical protein